MILDMHYRVDQEEGSFSFELVSLFLPLYPCRKSNTITYWPQSSLTTKGRISHFYQLHCY